MRNDSIMSFNEYLNENSGFISLLTLIVALLTFVFMVYEFIWKNRLKIKVIAKPPLINFNSNSLDVDFEVLNLSYQSLGQIESIGIWIKRWNSYGTFYSIKLQKVLYKEKFVFSEDIKTFLDSTILNFYQSQSKFDKLFKPKIKFVFKTTTDKEIEIIISNELKELLDNYINKVKI